ncbi:MAG TPA: Ig-like domain-containing protein, partial [Tepidisphaeraceae bacterium]
AARKVRRGCGRRPVPRYACEALEVRICLAATVTLTTHYPVGSELGPQPVVFEATRAGDLSGSLDVSYTLSGTAGAADYLVMDSVAHFDPGAAKAFVALIPQNDTLQEGDESVTLTLNAGAAYTLGTPKAATGTIRDAFLSGFGGVLDASEGTLTPVDLQASYALISGQNLVLGAALSSFLTIGRKVSFFIDADQNPQTGDYRPGHVRGIEYRVDAELASIFADASLYAMRTTAPADGLNPDDDISIVNAALPISYSNGVAQIQVPLNLIGNPTGVDVFAKSYTGNAGTATTYYISGDRSPDYGAIDTRTQHIVIRKPAASQSVSITDPTFDNAANGFDLTQVTYEVFGDQFFLSQNYRQSFDPTQPNFPGPEGTIYFDVNRGLLPGAFDNGADVPTFGIDTLLQYGINSGGGGIGSAAIFVQTVDDVGGHHVEFGGPGSDGRWATLSSGAKNGLQLSGSIGLLDTKLNSNASVTPTRALAKGPVYFQAYTDNVGGTDYDGITASHTQMIDSATGLRLDSLTFDTSKAVFANDPNEFGNAVPDVVQVQGEVQGDLLIVRAFIKNFIASDFTSLFDILIDADNNPLTAPLGVVSNPTNGGGPTGVDFIATVQRSDSVGPVTLAGFKLSTGLQIRDDAAVSVHPAATLGQNGSFTISIPLSVIGGNPTAVRLYVGAGDYLVGQGDIGPAAPLLVPVSGDITPPIVVSSSFDYIATRPRLRVRFSEDVSASLIREDLSILNMTTGQTIAANAMALSYDPSSQTATITFPSYPGSLPDGNYRARIASGGVTDAAGNPLPTDFTLDFFSLSGDANHDRSVDFNDLVVLAQNYNTTGGKTFDLGDFNYDGNVDFNDLVNLAQNYNKTLPFAAATPSESDSVLARVSRQLTQVRPVARPVHKSLRRKI